MQSSEKENQHEHPHVGHINWTVSLLVKMYARGGHILETCSRIEDKSDIKINFSWATVLI